jgi:hypothetical protein
MPRFQGKSIGNLKAVSRGSWSLNGHGATRTSAQTFEERREHDQLTYVLSQTIEVCEALEKDNASARLLTSLNSGPGLQAKPAYPFRREKSGQCNGPSVCLVRKGRYDYAGPARGETFPAFFSFFSSLLSLRDLAGFFFPSFFVSLALDISRTPFLVM